VLVTFPDAFGVLGEPVDQARPKPEDPTQCAYNGQRGDGTLGVIVKATVTRAEFDRSARGNAANSRLPGIGDAAYFNHQTEGVLVSFLKGSTRVTLVVSWFKPGGGYDPVPDAVITRLKSFAPTIAARL
jgi:hypothetical protein